MLAAGTLAGCAIGPRAGSEPAAELPLLLQPEHPDLNRPPPERFKVLFETTAGDFVVEVTTEWAPLGAARFYNLVHGGFYERARFFRVIPGFMAQFGIHADPEISAAWRGARLIDDPVTHPNERGYVTFATGGPDTRTTQLFINFGDNSRLDELGFAPIARIVEGEEVIDEIYREYGEGYPRGSGPSQAQINEEGEAYLEREFPLLDRILTARIISVTGG
jgi:peptidyl-prolyl cis-trans isomerase A (cyclophilin A)